MASKREMQPEITMDPDEIACGRCRLAGAEQGACWIGEAGVCCQGRIEQTVVFHSTQPSADPDEQDWGKTP
jgi:hypothetical protein